MNDVGDKAGEKQRGGWEGRNENCCGEEGKWRNPENRFERRVGETQSGKGGLAGLKSLKLKIQVQPRENIGTTRSSWEEEEGLDVEVSRVAAEPGSMRVSRDSTDWVRFRP